jgi:hypothetical protein
MENVDVSDLQFKEYARYVDAVLADHGMQRVNEDEAAQLIIGLAYGISDPKTLQESVPIKVTTGGYSTFSGTAYGTGGFASMSGTTWTPESTQVVGSQVVTQTYYIRHLSLLAVDVASSSNEAAATAWELHASSAGQSGDLRAVFPVMLFAASPHIGADTGAMVHRRVALRNRHVEELRERAASPVSP